MRVSPANVAHASQSYCANLLFVVFSRSGGYRTMFSGGARTLSQSRCSCRPTPGARVLVVLYPAFRADALHAGLLADTRSAGSVSHCAAELISPTREAVARSVEAPRRSSLCRTAADDKAIAHLCPAKGAGSSLSPLCVVLRRCLMNAPLLFMAAAGITIFTLRVNEGADLEEVVTIMPTFFAFMMRYTASIM